MNRQNPRRPHALILPLTPRRSEWQLPCGSVWTGSGTGTDTNSKSWAINGLNWLIAASAADRLLRTDLWLMVAISQESGIVSLYLRSMTTKATYVQDATLTF
uniref:Uncharacterized protein n=1 Tax=Macrostomum lignano TaxID=282301 RepID=A0A1I8HDN3_9PLAT